jgi:uncharacterized protein (DUF2345 family)
MPEIGDAARLRFSDTDEGSGVVESATRTEAPGRVAPDRKSLKTKWGKEVILSPTTITLSNNKGLSVALDDRSGIHLISDKDITLVAENNLSVVSLGGDTRVSAGGGIKLSQRGTEVGLRDDVTFSGGQVNTQA